MTLSVLNVSVVFFHLCGFYALPLLHGSTSDTYKILVPLSELSASVVFFTFVAFRALRSSVVAPQALYRGCQAIIMA
jgi:hypothetical protein